MIKIGVVGAGKMVRALLVGSDLTNVTLNIYSPSGISARSLASDLGHVSSDKLEDLAGSDVILLAFKPQNLAEFIVKYSHLFKGRAVVSILAGVGLEKIENGFNTNDVMRIMPNLHSEYGQGYNLFSYTKNFSVKLRQSLEKIFSKAGSYYVCSEEELDSLTLFSGSGPAFVYDFLKTINANITQNSTAFTDNKKLLISLLRGSALTLENSEKSFDDLIEDVASKGGVTQQALDSLARNGMQDIYSQSFLEAKKKIEEFKNS
jgi:pyrroline-5-carboxylate reductase